MRDTGGGLKETSRDAAHGTLCDIVLISSARLFQPVRNPLAVISTIWDKNDKTP